jgi:hypothetical protein
MPFAAQPHEESFNFYFKGGRLASGLGGKAVRQHKYALRRSRTKKSPLPFSL